MLQACHIMLFTEISFFILFFAGTLYPTSGNTVVMSLREQKLWPRYISGVSSFAEDKLISGNFIIAEPNSLWTIYPNSTAILVCGRNQAGYKDGRQYEAMFDTITDLEALSDQTMLIADYGNGRVRIVYRNTTRVTVTTLADITFIAPLCLAFIVRERQVAVLEDSDPTYLKIVSVDENFRMTEVETIAINRNPTISMYIHVTGSPLVYIFSIRQINSTLSSQDASSIIQVRSGRFGLEATLATSIGGNVSGRKGVLVAYDYSRFKSNKPRILLIDINNHMYIDVCEVTDIELCKIKSAYIELLDDYLYAWVEDQSSRKYLMRYPLLISVYGGTTSSIIIICLTSELHALLQLAVSFLVLGWYHQVPVSFSLTFIIMSIHLCINHYLAVYKVKVTVANQVTFQIGRCFTQLTPDISH